MTTVQNFVKTPFSDMAKLYSIFNDQPNLAWDMLEQQCDLYTSANVDVEEINKLTSFYCKILIKLNELQDPRQKYFSNKMQKLMAEPFVIRCYTDDCSEQKNTNIDLKQKRKEMQQKISLQTQKQNSLVYQHIIQSQAQREKRLKYKIYQVIEQHEKNLQNRLKLRLMKKNNNISSQKKNFQDSTITRRSVQLVNTEFTTPNKSQTIDELSFLDMISIKSKFDSPHRPQSERLLNYQREETNEDSSSDSEDQYRIQKILKQESIRMQKKRQGTLFGQNSSGRVK